MEEMMNKILANIPSFMNDTSLSESFFEKVLNRLVSFGYILDEDDTWMICFAMQKVENHIKNSCNTSCVPDGLCNVAVDMACGDFLFAMKQCGKLKLSDLNLDGAVTSIKEGDVQINFGTGASDDEKFSALLNYLLNNGSGDLICYRKMLW